MGAAVSGDPGSRQFAFQAGLQSVQLFDGCLSFPDGKPRPGPGLPGYKPVVRFHFRLGDSRSYSAESDSCQGTTDPPLRNFAALPAAVLRYAYLFVGAYV